MSNYNLLTIDQIIESENRYIKKNSFNKLINTASEKISNYIKKNFNKKKILFVCGPGNNGMDGQLAFNRLNKVNTSLFRVTKNNTDFLKLKNLIKTNEIIFDCIFGIGLNRKIIGNFKKVIQEINQSKKKVVSIDIPSGINSDSGKIMGVNIKSDITLAMGFLKPGYYLFPGKEFIGKIQIIKLKLKVPSNIKPKITLIKKSLIKNVIPKHSSNINKYDKGHVIIVGGSMAGASRLVAFSARKTGCGLVTIGIEKKYVSHYSQIDPGTIVKIFNKKDLEQKDVLVIGPGLGRTFNKKKILSIVNSFIGPIIIDADAISIFQNYKNEFVELIKKKKHVVLTPHEGEFKRIFTFNKQSKIFDCFEASKIVDNCVLLKGNDSVISFPVGRVWLNSSARNNLATAGSGDILCGILAGLLSQKIEINFAVPCAIVIQNKISRFQNDVVVEDFLKHIPEVMRSLKK